MKRNIGKTDTIIRILIAIIIAVLYFTGVIGGTLAIILGIVALVLVITSITGFCGLYAVCGRSSCKIKD